MIYVAELCGDVPCDGIILAPVKPGVPVGAAIIAGGGLTPEHYINIGNGHYNQHRQQALQST